MPDWPISVRLKEYFEVQYDLRQILGEGGMGVVLLANERVLDRLVAIKVLHKHLASNPELRERFRREARVAAKLTHPNIVPLHAFGEVDGELFFVMGYVEGETLAARLNRAGRIDEDDALRILREVCDALALAHGNRIVHRDLKPENILIEARTGRALLADFGIAREGSSAAALTGTGVVMGTPHYMSPEQIAGDNAIDHRSDIYAAGVVGYRLLAGRLPFDGSSVQEILMQHVAAKARDLSSEHTSISPRVAAAIMRCLEKDPGARWQDIAMLRDEIAMRVDGDEDLPDQLRGLDSSSVALVATSATSALFGWLNSGWWHNEMLALASGVGTWLPLAAGALVTMSIGRRYGWARTLSTMWRPPKSWPLWWPRFARRRGDVWDRLPRAVRLARSLLFGSFVFMVPAGASIILFATVSPEQYARLLARGAETWALTAPALVIAMMFAGAVGILYRWGRKTGIQIDSPFSTVWLGEPTAGDRWKRPEIARHLLPPKARGVAVPETAERLCAVIGEQIRALVRAGVLPSDDAAVAARDVVDAIERIDGELAMLARGGDPAELQRLDDRINAAAPTNLAPDLLQMLVRQRDAVRAIVRRQEDQRKRREQLAARLRELFAFIEDVRTSAAASADSSLTSRIDAVCSDLRRLALGYNEIRDAETTPAS